MQTPLGVHRRKEFISRFRQFHWHKATCFVSIIFASLINNVNRTVSLGKGVVQHIAIIGRRLAFNVLFCIIQTQLMP